MSIRPTLKQMEVFAYICCHVEECGFPPTRKEICEAFNWSSYNSAELHIQALVEKGLIKTHPGISRGISIVKKTA